MRSGQIYLRGFVATPDGMRMACAELTGPTGEPESLGLQLATLLRAEGAGEILSSLA